MVKLIEICESMSANKNTTQNYILREVYINPEHIISLREDDNFLRKLNEGKLPSNLDENHRFTRMMLDKGQTGLEIVVVGAPHLVKEKIKAPTSELLLG